MVRKIHEIIPALHGFFKQDLEKKPNRQTFSASLDK
jgi:hypothetical protein